jgi:hypothetical protein
MQQIPNGGKNTKEKITQNLLNPFFFLSRAPIFEMQASSNFRAFRH